MNIDELNNRFLEAGLKSPVTERQYDPAFQTRPNTFGGVRGDVQGDHYEGSASYLTGVLTTPEEYVQKASDTLRNIDFDTIIGIGLSGALIVPALARHTGKKFAIVRKPSERTGNHSGRVLEGRLGRRWIFVDDQISSGDTYRNVQDAIDRVCEASGFYTTLVGSYQYLFDAWRYL